MQLLEQCLRITVLQSTSDTNPGSCNATTLAMIKPKKHQKLADPSLQSGVVTTSQMAIAPALILNFKLSSGAPQPWPQQTSTPTYTFTCSKIVQWVFPQGSTATKCHTYTQVAAENIPPPSPHIGNNHVDVLFA